MLTATSLEAGYCEPAHVLEVSEDFSVQLRLGTSDETAWATLATREPIKPGDRVLVTGRDLEELYVIGVMPSASTPRRIRSSSGAYAEISGPPSAERLQVYSHGGQLLVEIDPQTNRTRVLAESTHLELAAPQGNVAITAGQQIRMAAASVDIQAARAVRMTAGLSASESSTLRLDDQSAQLQSNKLQVEHQRAEAHVHELNYTGKSFRLSVSALRFAADRLETVAGNIVERARQVFRTVKGLSQLRAGRIRERSETTWHVKAEKVNLKSTDDFKVQGRTIHLG